MATTCRIPWVREYTNEAYWNEVCAWAIEHYGLPGDRFMTHANVDYMDFTFIDDKDALLFSLMFNSKMLNEQDMTVDHVGRLINGF